MVGVRRGRGPPAHLHGPGAGPAGLTSRRGMPGSLRGGGAESGVARWAEQSGARLRDPRPGTADPAAAMHDPARGWSLSFTGCGFLGFYHIGATCCLSERAPHLLRDARTFFGASAGALHCVTFLAGVPLGTCGTAAGGPRREGRPQAGVSAAPKGRRASGGARGDMDTAVPVRPRGLCGQVPPLLSPPPPRPGAAPLGVGTPGVTPPSPISGILT